MKQRNAFTLIELLVAIAIIALLLSTIMPALKAAKLQAQGAVCLTNVGGLARAWTVYADENNGRIVGSMVGSTRAPFYCWVAGPETQNGVPVSPENSTAEDEIRGIKKGLLFPYSESETIYHCPSDTRYLKPPTTVNGTGVGGYRSFSLVGGIGPNSQNEIAWQGYVPHLKISTIRSPGDKYILVEEADGRGLNVNSWIIKPQTPNTWIDPIAIWHLKHSTLGFADGHGQKHRWEDKSTILMAKEQRTNFGDIGPGEGGDLAFMIRGFPFERYYSP
ncbi:MAG TPA: type II secretion system protein [Anaerohalosphaeraceae bacterium]|jgi:prepilin-type N-terminal cleavage/methylation domain-containing protein|nr:type II secretion system protein [Anaerohalosphaeraceae bacterium]